MIKKLLVVVAAGALISMACFTVVGLLGGFPQNFGPQNWGPDGPPWMNGGGNYGRNPGPEVTRNLPFTGSDRLDIGYPAEITMTQGPETRFTVTGPQSVVDQLQLEGGSLRTDAWRRGRWGGQRYRGGRLRIDIVTPNMHEFELSGAQQLHLRNFDQDSLSLHISGSADIDGAGKARRLEAHISGAGHLSLDQLVVDDAELHISGAGDAHLDARQFAEVHISGAGNVHLNCRPARGVDVQKSGFGDVSYGSDCGALPPPVAPTAPASPANPVSPATPSAPAPKSKV